MSQLVHLMRMHTALIALLFFMSGCATTPHFPVRIEYRAAPDQMVESPNSSCIQIVGFTHIHPSWENFDRTDLRWRKGIWSYNFRVPAGEHSFRIQDPDACGNGWLGTVVRHITINGKPVSRQVMVPGNANTYPGFAFTVDPAGNVKP